MKRIAVWLMVIAVGLTSVGCIEKTHGVTTTTDGTVQSTTVSATNMETTESVTVCDTTVTDVLTTTSTTTTPTTTTPTTTTPTTTTPTNTTTTVSTTTKKPTTSLMETLQTTTTTIPTQQTPTDLTQSIESCEIVGRQTDDRFVNAYTAWAIKLFQKSAMAKRGENVILSPLSMQIALGIAANGANGNTQEELLRAIGGDIPLDELNGYMNTMLRTATKDESSVLTLANAVWLRNDIAPMVKPTFLQAVSGHYRASVYAEDFNNKTLEHINGWVSEKTNGRVDNILDSIGKDDMVYLLNAAAFEDEWKFPYHEKRVKPGAFHTINGEERKVSMMQRSDVRYYDDGDATGFNLQFKKNLNFSVLLPNEDINVYDYIDRLTAEQLLWTLDNPKLGDVITKLPKFKYESEFRMKDILQSMGVRQAFSKGADFSNILTEEPLQLENVLHKANITVDEAGTRAGAATITIMTGAAAPLGPRPEPMEITLDRPFVYVITEAETNVPVFFGVVTDIGK